MKTTRVMMLITIMIVIIFTVIMIIIMIIFINVIMLEHASTLSGTQRPETEPSTQEELSCAIIITNRKCNISLMILFHHHDHKCYINLLCNAICMDLATLSISFAMQDPWPYQLLDPPGLSVLDFDTKKDLPQSFSSFNIFHMHQPDSDSHWQEEGGVLATQRDAKAGREYEVAHICPPQPSLAVARLSWRWVG